MNRYGLLFAALALTACTLPVATPKTGTGTEVSSVVSQQERGEADDTIVNRAGTGTGIDQKLLPSGLLQVGSAEAPVSLLLFTHHSCSYCRSFQRDLQPNVMRDYVRTGKVKLLIATVNLLKYEQSEEQSKLLICSALQEKGMAVHDALFDSNANAVIAMQEIGLDRNAITTCMEDPANDQKIANIQSFSSALDAKLVPTYFINGTKYQGLPDWADLRGQIELELSKK